MTGRIRIGLIAGLMAFAMPGPALPQTTAPGVTVAAPVRHPGYLTCAVELSIRNIQPTPVANVQVLIIFYGTDGLPIDSSITVHGGQILPNLAKRVVQNASCSSMDAVKWTSGSPPPALGVEFRVIGFQG